MKFFRLLVRARYWKRRALAAENRCLDLADQFAAEKIAIESQAESERWRNVGREDMFVSAAIMGGRGMVGIPPRTGPAATRQTTARVQTSANPFDALTWREKAEFETEWLAPGLERGLSRPRIESDFLANLTSRKTLSDEPIAM